MTACDPLANHIWSSPLPADHASRCLASGRESIESRGPRQGCKKPTGDAPLPPPAHATREPDFGRGARDPRPFGFFGRLCSRSHRQAHPFVVTSCCGLTRTAYLAKPISGASFGGTGALLFAVLHARASAETEEARRIGPGFCSSAFYLRRRRGRTRWRRHVVTLRLRAFSLKNRVAPRLRLRNASGGPWPSPLGIVGDDNRHHLAEISHCICIDTAPNIKSAPITIGGLRCGSSVHESLPNGSQH